MKHDKNLETGIIPMNELKKSPGYPSSDRFKQGSVAVIECIEEIPCNPCEQVCPNNAIKVGKPISNLPQLFEDKCNGCGLCIPICPGLAIFVVNETYSDNEAAISIPYELLPLPEKGEVVDALNRKGEVVCNAKIINVLNSKTFDKTIIVDIVVPKKFSESVRNIRLRR